jgi:hypothetical protein
MKISQKLFLAAALVAAVPAVSRACDDDRHAAPPAAYPAPPAAYPAPPSAYPAPYQGVRYGERGEWREHRDGRWRERERVRLELDRLEQARSDFYATWHRPVQVARFERWYSHRRAELDREWNAVSWYAAR